MAVTAMRGAGAPATLALGEGEEVTTPAFDLYSQPWIPVVRDSAEELVSLRTAITDAHRIDGLAALDGPRFAGLLRLLVALVMDVYGQPANDRDWAARREQGHFDAQMLDSYVAEVGPSRFDLFDREHPFMQSATVQSDPKSIAEMLPHVATGNRTPIWTPDTDATPRKLTFAQAAQALVAGQAVAVPNPGRAEGKWPKGTWKGFNFTGRAGAVGFCCPIAETLFETLMLNLPNGNHAARDKTDLPIWRRGEVPSSRCKRPADGMADLLTWTPRRVRLIPEEGSVSRLFLRAGDTMPDLVLDHEPHTAFQQSDGKGEGAKPAGQWYPYKHRRDSIGWRGIPQLLALGDRKTGSRPSIAVRALGDRLELLPPDYRITVLSMYVEYGGNGSVVKDIATDSFPLPVRAFELAESDVREIDVRDMLVDLVGTADRVGNLVRSYAADVYAVTQRDRSPNSKDRKASKSFADSVEADLNSRIDTITRRFLTQLAANPSAMDTFRAEWNTRLRGLVDAAVTQVNTDCGPSVFALIHRTNSAGRKAVAVNPPAIRQTQLRGQLDLLLGPNEEASA